MQSSKIKNSPLIFHFFIIVCTYMVYTSIERWVMIIIFSIAGRTLLRLNATKLQSLGVNTPSHWYVECARLYIHDIVLLS